EPRRPPGSLHAELALWIEPVDLARDPDRQLGRVKRRDGSDSRASLHESLPGLGRAVPERRQRADPGHDRVSWTACRTHGACNPWVRRGVVAWRRALTSASRSYWRNESRARGISTNSSTPAATCS